MKESMQSKAKKKERQLEGKGIGRKGNWKEMEKNGENK